MTDTSSSTNKVIKSRKERPPTPFITGEKIKSLDEILKDKSVYNFLDGWKGLTREKVKERNHLSSFSLGPV